VRGFSKYQAASGLSSGSQNGGEPSGLRRLYRSLSFGFWNTATPIFEVGSYFLATNFHAIPSAMAFVSTTMRFIEGVNNKILSQYGTSSVHLVQKRGGVQGVDVNLPRFEFHPSCTQELLTRKKSHRVSRHGSTREEAFPLPQNAPDGYSTLHLTLQSSLRLCSRMTLAQLVKSYIPSLCHGTRHRAQWTPSNTLLGKTSL
jgi:hypothetical protein